MNVLIAYGTTEGQTRKIARHMARTLEDKAHSVTLYDCADRSSEIQIGEFDVVFLAASVHNKRYQSTFYEFVETNLAALQQKPVAFVSVSLAITLAGGEVEAHEYVDDFAEETGLKLDAVHLAEGAVRYFQYSSSEASTINLVVFKGQKKCPNAALIPSTRIGRRWTISQHALLATQCKMRQSRPAKRQPRIAAINGWRWWHPSTDGPGSALRPHRLGRGR